MLKSIAGMNHAQLSFMGTGDIGAMIFYQVGGIKFLKGKILVFIFAAQIHHGLRHK